MPPTKLKLKLNFEGAFQLRCITIYAANCPWELDFGIITSKVTTLGVATHATCDSIFWVAGMIF